MAPGTRVGDGISVAAPTALACLFINGVSSQVRRRISLEGVRLRDGVAVIAEISRSTAGRG